MGRYQCARAGRGRLPVDKFVRQRATPVLVSTSTDETVCWLVKRLLRLEITALNRRTHSPAAPVHVRQASFRSENFWGTISRAGPLTLTERSADEMDNGTPGSAGRPWGATRLGPYPTTMKMPFTAVGIDPSTQLGVFRDASGRIVKMDQEGTRQSTNDSTSTSTSTSTYNSSSTGTADSYDSDDFSDSDDTGDSDFNADDRLD